MLGRGGSASAGCTSRGLLGASTSSVPFRSPASTSFARGSGTQTWEVGSTARMGERMAGGKLLATFAASGS